MNDEKRNQKMQEKGAELQRRHLIRQERIDKKYDQKKAKHRMNTGWMVSVSFLLIGCSLTPVLTQDYKLALGMVYAGLALFFIDYFKA